MEEDNKMNIKSICNTKDDTKDESHNNNINNNRNNYNNNHYLSTTRDNNYYNKSSYYRDNYDYDSKKANSKYQHYNYKKSDFYLKYYIGHQGKFGHEFLEFEIRDDGRMRYINNSNYKSDTLIKKEVYLNEDLLEEIKRIIRDSGVMKVNNEKWNKPDESCSQYLKIDIDGSYKKLISKTIGSYSQVLTSEDPDGLNCFYYLIQDLKCMVFSLISLNFRVKPVQA